MMDCNPPFLATYKSLLAGEPTARHDADAAAWEYCELPLIDLGRLHDEPEAERCKEDIVAAASKWGFFQIVNHGVPEKLLTRLREEQVKMFRQSFKKKADDKFQDLAGDSYRWGTPTATSLKQLSWSEAYHIPLSTCASELPADGTSSSRYLYFEHWIYIIFCTTVLNLMAVGPC